MHLKSRTDALEIILEELKPHIIVLSEHDMKSDEIERLNINNYSLNSYFSRQKSKNGGVMILSQNELRGKQVAIPDAILKEIREEKLFEFCASMYKVDSFKFIVVGLYRSPSSPVNNFIDKLDTLIEYLSKKCQTVIWAGDININVLANSKEHEMLKNLLKSHHMTYLIDFPTRVSQFSQSSIDNILVKKSLVNSVSVSGVITLLSDHDGQVFEMDVNTHLPKVNYFTLEETRLFSQENIDIFNKFIENEIWQEVYFASVYDKYDIFYNIFKYYFDQAFPKKNN